MKAAIQYIPIKSAKNVLPDLVGKIKASDNSIVITINGVPEAALISMKRFDDLLQASDVLANNFSGTENAGKCPDSRSRTVSTFLGRKRILMGEFHEIERQALNTPIQGGAAGIVNRVTVSLDNEVEKRNLKAYPVLQIYDQILYEVKDDNIKEFASLMKEETSS